MFLIVYSSFKGTRQDSLPLQDFFTVTGTLVLQCHVRLQSATFGLAGQSAIERVLFFSCQNVFLKVRLGLIYQKETSSCRNCIPRILKPSSGMLLRSLERRSVDFRSIQNNSSLEIQPSYCHCVRGCSLSIALLHGFLLSFVTTLTTHPAHTLSWFPFLEERKCLSPFSNFESIKKTTGSLGEVTLRISRHTVVVIEIIKEYLASSDFSFLILFPFPLFPVQPGKPQHMISFDPQISRLLFCRQELKNTIFSSIVTLRSASSLNGPG